MTKSKLKGKGFYIVLVLCIIAVGTAGYVTLQETGTTPDSDPAALPQVVSSNILLPVPERDEPTASIGTEQPEKTPEEPSEPEKSNAAAPPKQEAPKSESQTPQNGAPRFVKPTSGVVLQSFSENDLEYSETFADWRCHIGTDYAAGVGEQVAAVADGVVANVYTDEVFGTVIEIAHAGNFKSVYFNLLPETLVKTGDTVSCGEVIGGVSDLAIFESEMQTHLHLELYKNGVCVNPEKYLKD